MILDDNSLEFEASALRPSKLLALNRALTIVRATRIPILPHLRVTLLNN